MKYILFILFVMALPALVTAQLTNPKAAALLDSLKTTLNNMDANSFMCGIDSLPNSAGLSKNGQGFFMKAREGNAAYSCICTCYCACKTENEGMMIFRLKSIKKITLTRHKKLLNLYFTNVKTPAIIKINNPEKLADVKGWFNELANYCRKN